MKARGRSMKEGVTPRQPIDVAAVAAAGDARHRHRGRVACLKDPALALRESGVGEREAAEPVLGMRVDTGVEEHKVGGAPER